MRSEHKSTGDEIDMRAGFWDREKGRWRYWYIYIGRAGVRKSIKRASHKKDRKQAKMRLKREIE